VESNAIGQRVTREGIGTDLEKVAAIAELDPPSTERELRQYLGLYLVQTVCT